MSKTYPASLENLHEMLNFVRKAAKKIGFSDADFVKIELAVEEALVNIIKHGYPEKPGTISISCDSTKEDCLQIEIRDQGIPYNPLAHVKLSDHDFARKNQRVGGYGVFFILKIMDEIKYERENDSNILILTKYKI
mgnify:CR=1 FL=1